MSPSDLLGASLPPDSSVVILPTYNEKDNLPILIPRILDQGPEWRVLVVDDASPDGTAEVAAAMAEQDPRIRVLRRSGPRGLGLSHRDGLTLALNLGFEFIFMMDSDLSHPAEALSPMRRLAAEHGASLGSRYVPGLSGSSLRTRKPACRMRKFQPSLR